MSNKENQQIKEPANRNERKMTVVSLNWSLLSNSERT